MVSCYLLGINNYNIEIDFSYQSSNMTIDSGHSTLDLPRIMALHGGGTNSTIFRMQCRVLERALRPYFRLV